jgi:hypothetical protein
VLVAQAVQQVDGVVRRVDAHVDGPVPRGEHRDRARRDRRAVATGQALLVAAKKLRRERAAALRPERDVRHVAELAGATTRRAVLGAAEDGDLGRVEIDRDRLARLAPQRVV